MVGIGGLGGVLTVLVMALLRGWIVPKSLYDALAHQLEASQARVDAHMQVILELSRATETTVRVIDSLPKGGDSDG